MHFAPHKLQLMLNNPDLSYFYYKFVVTLR